MVKLRVAGVIMPGPRKLRVAGVVMTGSGTTPRLRVAGVVMTGVGKPSLQPIPDVTVDAFAPVTIQTALGNASPNPSGYEWRQIIDPDDPDPVVVTYSDGGDHITLIAPPASQGVTVVFGVTATLGGQSSPEVNANVIVRPHLLWSLGSDLVWRAVALPTRPF